MLHLIQNSDVRSIENTPYGHYTQSRGIITSNHMHIGTYILQA